MTYPPQIGKISHFKGTACRDKGCVYIYTYWLEFFRRSSLLSTDSRIPRSLPFACPQKPIRSDSRTAQAVRPRIPSTGRSTIRPQPLCFWPCTGRPVCWTT